MDETWWNTPIRPKRPAGSCSVEWEKLVIPMPLAVKVEVMRLAREHRLSQAAFGLVLVQAAIEDEAWLSAAIRSAVGQPYTTSGERRLVMDEQRQFSPKQVWTKGKKLCRFHLDPVVFFEVQRIAATRRQSMTQFIEGVLVESIKRAAA